MAEWAGAMADLTAGKPELAEPRLLAIVDGDAALDATVGLGLLVRDEGRHRRGRRVVRQGPRDRARTTPPPGWG